MKLPVYLAWRWRGTWLKRLRHALKMYKYLVDPKPIDLEATPGYRETMSEPTSVDSKSHLKKEIR